MKRRYTRLLFVQLIYNILCKSENTEVDHFNYLTDTEENKDFFLDTVEDMMEMEKYCYEFFNELIALLKKPIIIEVEFLQSKLYKALLLAALYEMQIHDKKLVIKEYLVLADYFDLNAKFIHGILDRSASNNVNVNTN
jgi:transcription termination factor NusB